MPDPPAPPVGFDRAVNTDRPVGPPPGQTDLARAVGAIPMGKIRLDHPAYQPGHDPLDGRTDQGFRIVPRDIPILETVDYWSVDAIRAALWAHFQGLFFRSSLLCDAVLGDARIQSALTQYTSALFGRQVIFEPANDSAAAKEVCDAWVEAWPYLSPDGQQKQLAWYAKLAGWQPSLLVWNTEGKIWKPQLRVWHQLYTWYHWEFRTFVAVSRDGLLAIEPGNGTWVIHYAGNGEYRGWVTGSALRAVAEPWKLRHEGFLDHARFNEVHGMPIRKGIVPAASSEPQRDRFAAQLGNLGRETTVMCAQGVDGKNGYDVELVEAGDTAWEAFPGLRSDCDIDIVIAILTENLTTEITSGGSYAASQTAESGLLKVVQAQNIDWCGWQGNGGTIRNQIARPFAWVNFGDADLAPKTWYDVPYEDYDASTKRFSEFATAINQLAQAGIQFTDPKELQEYAARAHGLRGMPGLKISAPVQHGGGATPDGVGAPKPGQKPIRPPAAPKPSKPRMPK